MDTSTEEAVDLIGGERVYLQGDRERQLVPRIVDPGGEGWAVEPKVSNAELLLYGEQAGVVRLLGQAAVASGDAYSLACKHSNEANESLGMQKDKVSRDGDSEDMLKRETERLESLCKVYDEAVRNTWDLYQKAIEIYQDTAHNAMAARKVTREVDYGAEPRMGEIRG